MVKNLATENAEDTEKNTTFSPAIHGRVIFSMKRVGRVFVLISPVVSRQVLSGTKAQRIKPRIHSAAFTTGFAQAGPCDKLPFSS